jgi:hypothetical protein
MIIWVNVSDYDQGVFAIGYMKLGEPGSFSVEEVAKLLHENGPNVTWKLDFTQEGEGVGAAWKAEQDGKSALHASYYVYEDTHGPRSPCLRIEPVPWEVPQTGPSIKVRPKDDFAQDPKIRDVYANVLQGS